MIDAFLQHHMGARASLLSSGDVTVRAVDGVRLGVAVSVLRRAGFRVVRRSATSARMTPRAGRRGKMARALMGMR